MSGCDWQKKSFQVSMKSTKVLDVCAKCDIPLTGVVFKFNGDVLCQKCFDEKPSLAQNAGLGFHTSKDKLWEFETRFGTKKFQIRSKGQWKRFMKQHGLHDDVDKPNFSKPSYKSVPRQEIAKHMFEKLQKDGSYHKLVPELRKALRRRK